MYKTNIASDRPLNSTYRPEIDGLRALAVIAVIINHFNKGLLPGGYLGVDIFFVISGYVITSSLAARPSERFGDLFFGFYERRVRRLVPALVSCVVITSLLICLLDPSPGASLKTGITSLFGLSNLYLLRQSTDYFATSTEANVFTQTWSLGVEEQFYVFFPFLVWLTGLGRFATGSRNLFWTISALSLASLVGFMYLSGANQPAAYFLMPARFWELGAGCLLFLSGTRKLSVHGFVRVEPLLFVAGVIGVLFIPSRFLVEGTFAVVLATLLLIGSTRPGTITHAIFSAPGVVYVGRISYSLYLWHWTVLSISRWTVGIHWWSVPFQVGIMLFFAIISYQYVETPLRRAKWSIVNWKTIGWGLSVSVSAALIGSVLLLKHDFLLIKGTNKLVVPPAFLPIKGSGLPYNPTCVVDGKERPLNTKTFDLCTVLPKRENGQMIWALGDSHAGHLQGLLYSIHDQVGVGVHLIETPGITFPLPNGFEFVPREIIFKKIMEKARSGDIILLARLFVDRASGNVLSDVAGWNSKVLSLAQTLSAKGLKIVVVGPPPHFQFENVNTCLISLFRRTSCDVDRAAISKGIDTVYRSLEKIATVQDNIYIFNQFNVFCPRSNAECSPIKDGTLLFRDKDHLNSFGSASLADPFISFLQNNNLLESQSSP